MSSADVAHAKKSFIRHLAAASLAVPTLCAHAIVASGGNAMNRDLVGIK
jgi:hypothetical protein